MAHKKYQRRKSAGRRKQTTHGDSLVRLGDWLLPTRTIFAHLTFHGNTRWLPIPLVWLALCWSWSECRNLTEAAAYCRNLSTTAQMTTYQGFLNATPLRPKNH